MGNGNAAEIPMPNTFVAESSETTVEINIKTLDSRTYTLRVNKCVSVPALKEQIATITGVLSDQQRLICRGRVLKDDQLLSAYHVEDGHTLHLVVRHPHQSSPPFIVSEGLPVNPANSVADSLPSNSNQVSRTIVLEAFNLDQANIDSTSLNRIVAGIMNSIRASNSASGNFSTNIREATSERLPRPFGDTGAASSQNHLNINSQRTESDRQHEAFSFPNAVSSGPHNLPEISHSLITLRQYLAHLQNELRRDATGFNDRDVNINGEASSIDLNGGENVSLSQNSSRRDDLPSPAALAEILHSTRQLLVEHAEERLVGLARELENDSSATSYGTRLNIQSRAIRTGFFLQNLGSLLLELGRTTMTLRMGQGPTEAVVNSGPAVFISASGPSPVMVQPVPFYPASFGGMQIGSTNSGQGPDVERVVTSVLPRNVDIRIHTAPIPVASQSGLGGGQPRQEHSDSARTSGDGESVHEAAQTHPHGATLVGEYRYRVVPVRTVLTMPAGIGNSSSDLSDNLLPLLHPLLERIQQQNTGSTNSVLGPQVLPLHQGTFVANEEPIPDSMREMLESYNGSSLPETQVPSYTMPVVSEMSMSPTAPIEQHGATSQRTAPYDYNQRSFHLNDGHDVVQDSLPEFLSRLNHFSSTVLHGEQISTGVMEQHEPAPGSHIEQASIHRDAELNEASSSANDQGVLFSNFLHQLMPLLAQTHGVNLSGPSSSQHQRDTLESPSPKRQKKD